MFQLPVPAPYTLVRSPLAQALIQARFPTQARFGVLDGMIGLQSRLQERYPYLSPPDNNSLVEVPAVGAGVKAMVQHQRPYIFSGDEGFSVWIEPNALTLTADSSYQGARDFLDRFQELLIVLHDLKVPRCDRLGVRFLTLAQMPPGEPQAWRTWFVPEVTGWVGTEVLSPDTDVSSAINEVQVRAATSGELREFPASVQGIVRHGLVPMGSVLMGIPPLAVQATSFVMDIDLYCEAPQPWIPETLSSQAEALHSQVDRFFRWTLTDVGAAYFELEVRA